MAGGIAAVGTSADQAGIGAPVEALEAGVVAAIEHVLHCAGKGGQVFRRCEDVAVGGNEVLGGGVFGGKMADDDGFAARG